MCTLHWVGAIEQCTLNIYACLSLSFFSLSLSIQNEVIEITLDSWYLRPHWCYLSMIDLDLRLVLCVGKLKQTVANLWLQKYYNGHSKSFHSMWWKLHIGVACVVIFCFVLFVFFRSICLRLCNLCTKFFLFLSLHHHHWALSKFPSLLKFTIIVIFIFFRRLHAIIVSLILLLQKMLFHFYLRAK